MILIIIQSRPLRVTGDYIMSQGVKKVNRFFKNCNKQDEQKLYDKMLLTERQEEIYRMYYLKDKDINFIADTLNVSSSVVAKELKIIRKKILLILETV